MEKYRVVFRRKKSQYYNGEAVDYMQTEIDGKKMYAEVYMPGAPGDWIYKALKIDFLKLAQKHGYGEDMFDFEEDGNMREVYYNLEGAKGYDGGRTYSDRECAEAGVRELHRKGFADAYLTAVELYDECGQDLPAPVVLETIQVEDRPITYWYAVVRDEDDNDWGEGSFELPIALAMCRYIHDVDELEPHICVIDAKYNAEGHPTADPVCINEIHPEY